MRFSADLESFTQAVKDASAGISGNPEHPLLAGMLLEAGREVRLTSFDGDVMFTAIRECDIAEPGTALLPGKVFAEVMRSLSGSRLDFHASGSTAFISAGRSKFSLRCTPAENYPARLSVPQPKGIADGAELAAGIARVAPSVSTTGNPAFTCISAEPWENGLALVAADRVRIAMTSVPWTQLGKSTGALIPGWAAEKFTRGAKGEVTIGWGGGFSMSCAGLEVISREVQGSHLKWREMLPGDLAGVSVDAPALAASIRQVSLLMSTADPVTLAFSGKELTVSGRGDYGECVNYLETDGHDDITVSFGLGIILDGLAGCGDRAVLGFTGKDKPVRIYSADGGFRYLAAPRRVI